MVPEFTETLKKYPDSWPFPPVTCSRLDNGKFELKDGCTRALAAEKLNRSIWVCTYHDDTQQYTDVEWKNFQIQQNDHPKSKSNSGADLTSWCQQLIVDGTLMCALGFTYINNEKEWLTQAAQYCNNKTPNSGKSLDWWKRKMTEALGDKVATRYNTYSRKQLIEMYKGLAVGSNWGGKAHGDIDENGHHVWAMIESKYKNPNVIGAILHKQLQSKEQKLDVPVKKHTIIYAEKKMAGQNDEALFELRRSVLEYFNSVAKHYKCEIEVLFAPQIKNGKNKEDMYKLVSVS